MKIQVYPNGTIGGDRELLESCKDGDIPFVIQNTAPQVTFMPDLAVQKAVAEVTAKLGDTGRILVRESGTEPVIRVMVEAESKDVCEQYVDSVIEVIRAKGHCV